jgi:hypothetical protein
MKAHKKLRVLCASAVKLNASLLPVSGNSIVIPMPFKNSYLLLIPGLIIANLLTACTEQASKNTGTVEIGEIELTEYESLIAKNDLLLGMPVRIKHDYASGHLFILDAAHTSVIELDVQFNEIRRYGTKGRGPGEVQFSHDFFITAEHLFIVDGSRFFIHKFSRRDGTFISSLDYGELVKEANNGTLLSPEAPLTSNNNRPFVTYNETVLLPAHNGGDHLYTAVTWEGEKVSDIGDLPEDFRVVANDEEAGQSLKSNTVPAHELALAFPVNDLTNPDEVFIVYSAIPKIAKYNLEGEKIWEQTIPYTPEVDSLMIDLGNVLENHPDQPVFLLPVKMYMAGRSSPEGGLYLFTYTNMDTPYTPRRPMWVHQFDSEGNLVNRYKIISDTDQYYYPGMDFSNRRIFTPSFNESDVRMYPF